MIIYHITQRSAWDAAQTDGQYTADSLNLEGFIHASTFDQVVHTAHRYYRGQHGLVLLCIDTHRVKPEVKFETAYVDGEEQKFPHLYGPLNIDAVTQVVPFEPDENGGFHLPAAVKRA